MVQDELETQSLAKSVLGALSALYSLGTTPSGQLDMPASQPTSGRPWWQPPLTSSSSSTTSQPVACFGALRILTGGPCRGANSCQAAVQCCHWKSCCHSCLLICCSSCSPRCVLLCFLPRGIVYGSNQLASGLSAQAPAVLLLQPCPSLWSPSPLCVAPWPSHLPPRYGEPQIGAQQAAPPYQDYT